MLYAHVKTWENELLLLRFGVLVLEMLLQDGHITKIKP